MREPLSRTEKLLLAAGALLYVALSIASRYTWLGSLYPPARSRDERIYMDAGRRYIEGKPPISYNMEHPPLAKYIIGCCVKARLEAVCPALATWLSLLLAHLLVRRLTGSRRLAATIYILMLLDPLFMSLSTHNLLDTYMLLFASTSLYMLARSAEGGWEPRSLLAAGLLAGAAVASKLPAVFMLAGPWLLAAWRLHKVPRRSEALALALLLAATVYLASYTGDLLHGGPELVVRHHVEMIRFMSRQHGLNPVLAADGVLSYLASFAVWADVGNVTIVLRSAGNGTYTVAEANWSLYLHPHPYIEATYYQKNIAAPVAAAVALALLLSRWSNLGAVERLILSSHLTSLAMLLYGPIWWYMAPVLYTGYVVMGLAAARHEAIGKRIIVFAAGGLLVTWLLIAHRMLG